MRCLECNTPIGDKGSSHSLCRAHAACAVGEKYSSLACSVCEGLWNVANDEEDNVASYNAYILLIHWTKGFMKNSRQRGSPTFIWVQDEERLDFAALTARMKARQYVRENALKVPAFPKWQKP